MCNENEKAAIDFAAKETNVSVGNLLAEIEPLIVEYFYGKVKIVDTAIIYELPNGQKFKISAEQVA